ncbi:hypothetical protein ABZV60_33475 [Streptomyces sp. NPDC004787]|uniref:hypothetical protein n=1 Tax=Streptomyces sp. NPDC004787 TaxID=3154291 RepID=UPI0033A213B3
MEFFQADPGGGAFSLGHDRLGNDVAGVPDVPLLTAGALRQPALCALGGLLLELGAQGKLTLAVAVQAAPGGLVAGARGGDADDAEVHADEAVWLVRFGLGDLAGGEQVEDTAPLDQVGPSCGTAGAP